MAGYIYLVQMDIPNELEEEFNRIYDTQHVPNITKVPGVHGCARYKLESAGRNASLIHSMVLSPESSASIATTSKRTTLSANRARFAINKAAVRMIFRCLWISTVRLARENRLLAR